MNILYVTVLVLMCGLTVIVYVIQRLTDSLVCSKEENQSYSGKRVIKQAKAK